MNKVKVTAATAGLVAALGLSYTSSAYADDVDATVDANASESTSNTVFTPSSASFFVQFSFSCTA